MPPKPGKKRPPAKVIAKPASAGDDLDNYLHVHGGAPMQEFLDGVQPSKTGEGVAGTPLGRMVEFLDGNVKGSGGMAADPASAVGTGETQGPKKAAAGKKPL